VSIVFYVAFNHFIIMPPKKKAKPAPVTATDHDAMSIDTPTPKVVAESSLTKYDILKDPWTDEQETSLFKGVMKWKPNGMHKHFRMIALSEYLRNHGYDPQNETHTRIPGIWRKLSTMYNMPIIDDRENSFEYEEEFQGKYHEFELPPDDYATETFMRGRLENASEAGSSPPKLGRSPSPERAVRRRKRGETVTQARTRASTVEDTDDARISPVPSLPAKATRSGRRSRATAPSSSRQTSRETTVDNEMGEAEEEINEDEDQGTEEEESNSPKPSKGKRAKVDAPVTRKSGRKR